MPTIHCACPAFGPPLRSGRFTTSPPKISAGTDGRNPLPFLFLPVPERKVGTIRLHVDLVSGITPEHQSQVVDRLITLGERRVDIGQGDVPRVVMSGP